MSKNVNIRHKKQTFVREDLYQIKTHPITLRPKKTPFNQEVSISKLEVISEDPPTALVE